MQTQKIKAQHKKKLELQLKSANLKINAMPYFLSHYIDFKGRCPNKPYWIFVLTYKITACILSIPTLNFIITKLPYNEELLAYIGSIIDQIEAGDPVYALNLDEATPIIYDAFGNAILQLPHADTFTLTSLALFLLWSIILLPPFIAMTTCRLRDANTSQLWWFLLLPSALQTPLFWLSPNTLPAAILSSNIYTTVVTICAIVFFALVCAPSKTPNENAVK